jgi:tetratricopeptide (TPR) repeat protein
VVDPNRAGLAQARLGQFLWFAGDSDGALDVLREAVDRLPPEPPSVERARVLAAEARILMIHGRPEESRSRCEEAISAARSTGARAEEGHVLNTLGCDLMLLGDRRRAIELISEAKRIAEACSPEDLWRAYVNLAEALEQDGRVEEGVRLGIEGAEVLRRLGIRIWKPYILGQVASQLVRLGRLDEAERVAATGLETPVEGIDMAWLYGAAGEIDLHRGNLEKAREELERAAEAAGRTGDVQIRAMLTGRLALLAVLDGDPDRVAALVDEATARMDDGEYLFHTARVYAVALRAHADRAERARAMGDTRTAAEAERSGTALVERLERLLEADRWLVSPPPESVARAALAAAELERLKRATGPETWSAVADRWADLGFPLDLAYARWRQAETILAAGGAKAEASAALREAARLTAKAGASLLGVEIEALSRRARIELRDGAKAASTEPSRPEVERLGASSTCSPSSSKDAPTERSERRCSSPPRPRAPTSPTSSSSSTCEAASRRRPRRTGSD